MHATRAYSTEAPVCACQHRHARYQQPSGHVAHPLAHVRGEHAAPREQRAGGDDEGGLADRGARDQEDSEDQDEVDHTCARRNRCNNDYFPIERARPQLRRGNDRKRCVPDKSYSIGGRAIWCGVAPCWQQNLKLTLTRSCLTTAIPQLLTRLPRTLSR